MLKNILLILLLMSVYSSVFADSNAVTPIVSHLLLKNEICSGDPTTIVSENESTPERISIIFDGGMVCSIVEGSTGSSEPNTVITIDTDSGYDPTPNWDDHNVGLNWNRQDLGNNNTSGRSTVVITKVGSEKTFSFSFNVVVSQVQDIGGTADPNDTWEMTVKNVSIKEI